MVAALSGDNATSFRSVALAGAKGAVVVGCELDAWLSGPEVPQSLAGHDAQVLKQDAHGRSAIITRLEPDAPPLDPPVYAKLHRRPGVGGAVRTLIGRHRAARAWAVSWRMLACGLPVPRPLAYLIIRRGLNAENWLWCEAITSARSLHDIACDEAGHQWIADSGILESIATGIASMHEQRWFHGDLKWPNVLVDEATGQFWFADLDAASHYRFGRRARRARDLGRFILNAEEAGFARSVVDRFLDAYADAAGERRSDVQRCVEPILARLQQRHARRDRAATPAEPVQSPLAGQRCSNAD